MGVVCWIPIGSRPLRFRSAVEMCRQYVAHRLLSCPISGVCCPSKHWLGRQPFTECPRRRAHATKIHSSSEPRNAGHRIDFSFSLLNLRARLLTHRDHRGSILRIGRSEGAKTSGLERLQDHHCLGFRVSVPNSLQNPTRPEQKSPAARCCRLGPDDLVAGPRRYCDLPRLRLGALRPRWGQSIGLCRHASARPRRSLPRPAKSLVPQYPAARHGIQ